MPDVRHDTAIVLQGPILREDNFTYETVRRYRTNFPNTPIILSTWKSESDLDIQNIQGLGATVLTQPEPSYRGIQNSNMQMISSAMGIQEAARQGVAFVLKTRTDQRAYSERMLGLMHAAHANFPLSESRGAQHGRIIGLSLNSFAYRMYGLSDMFTFGTIQDLLNYWSGKLDDRTPEDLEVASNLREYAHKRICEVQYCSSYLAQTGWKLQWTLRDSWDAIASRFLILDTSAIDLLWPKYTMVEERWRTYHGSPVFQEIDFAMWLMMHSGTIIPDERILDEPW